MAGFDKGKFQNSTTTQLVANNLVNNNFTTLKNTSRFVSGARCIVRLNGKVAVFAMKVSWNIQSEIVELRTIDNHLPTNLCRTVPSSF